MKKNIKKKKKKTWNNNINDNCFNKNNNMK